MTGTSGPPAQTRHTTGWKPTSKLCCLPAWGETPWWPNSGPLTGHHLRTSCMLFCYFLELHVEAMPSHADCGCRHSCHKIWLGVNFHGRDFTSQAQEADVVLGHDYTRIVEQYQPHLHWHEEYREHVASYKKDGRQHQMYYPSVEAIQVRSVEFMKKCKAIGLSCLGTFSSARKTCSNGH